MGLFHFLFRRMCYHIFNKVDVDNSGYVEAIEVEVAIYVRAAAWGLACTASCS